MKKRFNLIFDLLPVCESFADIGCDHGLITKEMLVKNKCKTAVVSDISEKCLQKAKELLSDYIEEGIVRAFVSDGFKNLPPVELALIAGMGGEEIILILEEADFLPKKLVLQPMKNPDKLRRKLISLGYKFIRDFTFKTDDKFYDIMLVEKGIDSLSEEEILFGRDNLKEKGEAFLERLNITLRNNEGYLKRDLSSEVRKRITLETERIKKCLN